MIVFGTTFPRKVPCHPVLFPKSCLTICGYFSVSVHPTIEAQNDSEPSDSQVVSEPSESVNVSNTITRAEDKPSGSSAVLIPAADSQGAAVATETSEEDDQTSAMSIDEGEASESDQDNQSNNLRTGVSEGIPTSQPANGAGGHEPQVEREDTPAKVDETSPMEIDSSPSSPTSQESCPKDATNDSQSPLPEQISLVAQPREADQELELEEEAARDVNVVSSKVPGLGQLTKSQETHETTTVTKKDSFTPYESPLRYFHAYRFHPLYRETVPGGLRSLTYSNRIDPSKPLCPTEIAGEQCDETCEFQHLKSIVAPGKSPRNLL